jgi:hypothetical protein
MGDEAMSWAPEVMVIGNGGKWSRNALRFATKDEATASACNLAMRWTMVEDFRATEADEPVNYRWDDRLGLVRLEEVSAI